MSHFNGMKDKYKGVFMWKIGDEAIINSEEDTEWSHIFNGKTCQIVELTNEFEKDENSEKEYQLLKVKILELTEDEYEEMESCQISKNSTKEFEIWDCDIINNDDVKNEVKNFLEEFEKLSLEAKERVIELLTD